MRRTSWTWTVAAVVGCVDMVGPEHVTMEEDYQAAIARPFQPLTIVVIERLRTPASEYVCRYEVRPGVRLPWVPPLP